jgi:hypothetical protein
VLWGCEEDARQPLELDGDVMLRCPRRPLLENPYHWKNMFWIYRNYDRGILPEEGALFSQPHKLLELLDVLETAKSSAQAEQQERDMKRTQARSRMKSSMQM